MKKTGIVVYTLMLGAALAACGREDGAVQSRAAGQNANSVESVIQQQIAAENGVETAPTVAEALVDNADMVDPPADAAPVETPSEEPAGEADPTVDVDLTVLSSTMVYSEVYNMMYYPEDYIGKEIKMTGLLSAYHDEENGMDYYACIIQDATACCAQGIEFQPDPEAAAEADFPVMGDEVTVKGIFDLYEEDGYTYATLREAVVLN